MLNTKNSLNIKCPYCQNEDSSLMESIELEVNQLTGEVKAIKYYCMQCAKEFVPDNGDK